MIKEIIVVEGKDDTTAIKRAVEAETIETGGSAINPATIKRIALAQQRRGVIIFTDPDHAGERIRKIISAKVQGCKHAFITKEDAENKGDIGVENATPEVIRKALQNVRTEYEGAVSQLTMEDLIRAGLINHPEAASRRLEVAKRLGIGYCNGKQFYKRCSIFQISKEEFEAAVEQLQDKEEETL
ncbi:ribonuclease M5 [Paenibacillus larvae]|uniref:Ribonuclease M5 n=4 Tax=Paenibacillus larvae TaxID=1464 RepID=V9WCS6_9BACL|nr:ribonuclease M5 [Paenibacillus larvae]AHD07654.1 ribonuclease M5-like protein [Paenibacillus larvae subsp. larvae DSM 25430]AQR78861.1 ribonuclease M5 [Paenibacillus larvae subsp. larvae]AQT85163.1 ribonuclease M5 [Paenibacillus larvae subsp. pulvifaciens]AQZ47164.1 ribonuclease M5 [Paenibacillus larvae subsp. pulvifaciens]ARF68529.1 ribonuclease M5 [Paenibacillus larvae subsp. pulvifaciens]